LAFCSKCKRYVKERDKFCNNCGTEIGREEIEPTTLEVDEQNKLKNLQLRSAIIGWTIGGFFIFIGIFAVLFEQSLRNNIMGVLFLIFGLIVFPPFLNFLEKKYSILIRTGVKIVFFIIMAVILLATIPPQETTTTSAQITGLPPQPKIVDETKFVLKVAENYAKSAIDYGDYDSVYKMLSSSTKPSDFDWWSDRKITRRNTLLSGGVTYSFVRAENPQITGVTATVDIKYKRNAGGAVRTMTKTISLIKEGDSWKITEDVDFT
jgi:hypothetical protein